MLQPILSLQHLMQSHTLNSKKKFKYCENQHHLHACQIVNILSSINVNFLQFFVYNNLK